MARESTETGDPDTLQGQFPSEIEGAGGGGGGGGGTTSPTFIEDPTIGKPAGGRMKDPGGGNTRIAIAWDGRPVGGNRTGIYHDTDTPRIFQQYAQTFGFTASGTTATIQNTGVTLDKDWALGPIVNLPISVTAGTLSSIQLRHQINNFSPALFTTNFGNYLTTWNLTNISVGTATTFNLFMSLGLGLPAPYIDYPGGKFTSLAGIPGAEYGSPLGYHNNPRRQVFPLDTTQNITIIEQFTFNNAVSVSAGAVLVNSFNDTHFDALSTVGVNV